MMSNRRRPLFWTALAAGLMCCLSVSALSQSRLAPGFLANPNFWSPQEREQAEAYVDLQLQSILTAEEIAVSSGRDGLINPATTAGASERFVSQFSELVAGQLMPLMDSEALIVRLNAMVISMNLADPNALPVIEKGLADESAGVRYPAAKALEALLGSGKLAANQTAAVMDRLEQRVGQEEEVHVVQPLLDAMLAAPDNTAAVLDVLEQRLTWHAEHPNESYGPEANALQAVNTRLVIASVRPPAQIKQIAKLGGRFMLLAAQQLLDGKVPAEANTGHQDVIRVAHSALEFAHDNQNSNELVPPSPNDALRQANWAGVVGIAKDWSGVLKANPFNFTDADLQVASAPAPAGSAGE